MKLSGNTTYLGKGFGADWEKLLLLILDCRKMLWSGDEASNTMVLCRKHYAIQKMFYQDLTVNTQRMWCVPNEISQFVGSVGVWDHGMKRFPKH